MSEWDQLERLGNDSLLSAVAELVRRGNRLTAELLAHLAELDTRRLHLELGFPSLFAYCTEALHLSEPAAGRRIAAARLCRKFPELYAYLARGELHLSALCALGPHLSRNNAAHLLAACTHKTVRQIDEILAAHFPSPDLPAQIRRLPERGASVPPVPPVPPVPTPCRGPLEQRAPDTHRPTARIEPLSAQRYGVHFTADSNLRDKLERARALASHRLPSGDLARVIELALDALLEKLEKERFALTAHPRPQSPAANTRTRRVPAATAREVYLRDGAQCTFVSHDGRRCSARAFLELDHAVPWASGGSSTATNLRLLCRAHNQQRAREHFGAAYVSARIAAHRPRLTP